MCAQQTTTRKMTVKFKKDFHHFFICLTILSCTITALFMTWGAVEVEGYANSNYEFQSNFRTESTCFFTKYNIKDIRCTRSITNESYRQIAYYGVRIDCLLNSPLILISFLFFWYEGYGKAILFMAHLCAWTKSISLVAALTCVLIDDPSFLREVFEKSQFGSYESKILYSYTMVSVSLLVNICLIIAIVLVGNTPRTIGPILRKKDNLSKNDESTSALVETIRSEENMKRRRWFSEEESPV